eukprot:TRINITY_DN75836_c0_g1_i1.p1 TRINITY_DN75836_c0_g1~~TRINITY_DN75836_c0_g1_i1.p1  ORF type:complete len:389 (-),score=65.63 TRINITY_DN75836_c0_g1_i1:100-1266(-)
MTSLQYDVNGGNSAEMGAFMEHLQKQLQEVPPEEREGWMAQMMACVSRDPMEFFKDLNELRKMEGFDAKNNLEDIKQALERGVEAAAGGFAVDIGSQSGFIPGEYQVALPALTFVPTELPGVEGPDGQLAGLKLTEDCLTRLAKDHEEKGELERQRLYEGLWKRARELDVLDARWSGVSAYEGKCILVTCTCVFQMKALETPLMWRQMLLGSARLLQTGGHLVVKDQAPGGFSNRNLVGSFAAQLGLHLVVHECDGEGLRKGDSAGKHCMFFLRTPVARVLFPDESGDEEPVPFKEGHVVHVQGLKAKPELNGLTAVLGKLLETGRWECRIAVAVTPTLERKMVEAALKPDNLVQLMPRVSMVPEDRSDDPVPADSCGIPDASGLAEL